MDDPNPLVKVSFNLPRDELTELKRLAAERHTTATQVIRQGLATELYLESIANQGGQLLVKVGHKAQEIILRH